MAFQLSCFSDGGTAMSIKDSLEDAPFILHPNDELDLDGFFRRRLRKDFLDAEEAPYWYPEVSDQGHYYMEEVYRDTFGCHDVKFAGMSRMDAARCMAKLDGTEQLSPDRHAAFMDGWERRHEAVREMRVDWYLGRRNDAYAFQRTETTQFRDRCPVVMLLGPPSDVKSAVAHALARTWRDEQDDDLYDIVRRACACDGPCARSSRSAMVAARALRSRPSYEMGTGIRVLQMDVYRDTLVAHGGAHDFSTGPLDHDVGPSHRVDSPMLRARKNALNADVFPDVHSDCALLLVDDLVHDRDERSLQLYAHFFKNIVKRPLIPVFVSGGPAADNAGGARLRFGDHHNMGPLPLRAGFTVTPQADGSDADAVAAGIADRLHAVYTERPVWAWPSATYASIRYGAPPYEGQSFADDLYYRCQVRSCQTSVGFTIDELQYALPSAFQASFTVDAKRRKWRAMRRREFLSRKAFEETGMPARPEEMEATLRPRTNTSAGVTNTPAPVQGGKE